EAAGRGADIEAIESLGREREMIERMLELEGGARDMVAGRIGNGDGGVAGHRTRRLRDRRAVDGHEAALDGIARPRARRIKAARDQRFVEPEARQSGSRGSVPEG